MSAKFAAQSPLVTRHKSPEARARVNQTLEHWKVDTDLDSIRDENELTKLTELERTDWRALWTEVASLLKRAVAL
jgi:hypothetical protein